MALKRQKTSRDSQRDMCSHFKILVTGQKRSVPTIPRFRAFGHGKSATMAVHRLTLPLQMPPMTRNKRNMLKLRETAQTA